MNKRKKAKRNADPEARKAAWREDYRQRRALYLKNARLYQERNKEKHNLWCRHQASKTRVTNCTLTASEFYQWGSSQPKICHWCGVNCAEKFDIDHVVPISKGGKHELENLVISCAPCNRRKRNKLPEEFVAKYHLAPLARR
jgi:5-methylcytosine-specific restriction endonuclease McrA